MHPRLVVLFALASLTACGPRLIKLPENLQVAAADSFKPRANSGTGVLGYQVPSVKVTGQRAKGFSVGGLVGKQHSQQQRAFTVNGGAAGPLEVSCEAVQEGAKIMGRDRTRHTYSCGASNFELRVEEGTRDVFVGTARLNSIALDIESTDEMAKGPPQGPSGFHLRRAGRWLGSFEYFPKGNVYLAQDLAPDERDAVLTAMLAIQSTNLWFAKGVDANSSL